MVNNVNTLDLLVSTIYILVIFFLLYSYKPKDRPSYFKFFKLFIAYKLIFAILFALLYIFYFQGGDTFLYFDGSTYLIEQIYNNPRNTFELLFGDINNIRTLHYTGKEYILRYFNGSDTLLTSKLLIPFTLICFKQYIATTIIFTIVISAGIWKLYETMCKLYPSLYKIFALGILFYPTIGIWGSGILKDPIALMSVGFIFHAFYLISVNKRISSALIILFIFIYICLTLKPYILYLLLPCMLLWLQNRISDKIQNIYQKIGIFLFLSIVFTIAGIVLIQSISSGAGKYAIENIEEMAKGFQSWHTYLAETRNQSGYSLGKFEFSAFGIIQKTPAAIFVTFYRPFLFTDVSNFSLAFEGLQSFILLILTIYVFLRVGITKLFRILFFNKDVSAFILFAILFGLTVGMTSYNFGALSRYKIPCLPFFTASLAIIYHIGYIKPKRLKNKTKMN